MAFSDKDLTQY